MIKIIILLFLYFIERTLIYKYLKKIDKKERLKVEKMEEEHFNKMNQIKGDETLD